MKRNHKVIILRGLPGSGKTEFCKSLRDHVYVSMDDYWTKDGQPYEFIASDIPKAVRWTHDKFVEKLEQHKDDPKALIVVDNTHTRVWEMQFYLDKAYEAGWMTQVVRLEADVMDCASRGKHPVPSSKLLEMRDRFEDVASKRMGDRVATLEEAVMEQIKFGVRLNGAVRQMEGENG